MNTEIKPTTHPAPGTLSSGNRVKEFIEQARFPISEQILTAVLRKKANVLIEDYENVKRPLRDRPSMSERLLQAAALKLAKRIEAAVGIDEIRLPDGPPNEQLEYLARVCLQAEDNLKSNFQALMKFHGDLQISGIHLSTSLPENFRRRFAYVRPAEDRLKAELATQIRWGSDRAKTLAHELIVDKLKLTQRYVDMGSPVLDGNTINTKKLPEIVGVIQKRLRAKSQRVADAFIAGVQNGLKEGLYREVEGLGRTSQTFYFVRHHVVSDFQDGSLSFVPFAELAVNFNATWKRGVRRVTSTQTLVSAKLYDFDALMNNPALEVPYNYRPVLKFLPPVLHDLLSGLFGTQVSEHHVPDDETDVVLHTSQAFLPCEPAVLFAGKIALFGWGAEAMATFDDHQKLVNHQRRMLNAEANARGKARTFLTCGLILTATVIMQAALVLTTMSLLFGLIATVPGLVCAALFLSWSAEALTYADKKKLAEKTWTADELQRLELKYPGFEASSPKLVKEADTE